VQPGAAWPLKRRAASARAEEGEPAGGAQLSNYQPSQNNSGGITNVSLTPCEGPNIYAEWDYFLFLAHTDALETISCASWLVWHAPPSRMRVTVGTYSGTC
jgi:hypothetical protein